LEAFRRAFFDRAEFMGDPDFFQNSRGPAHRQTIWRGLAGIDQSGACQREHGFGPAGDLQPARTIRVAHFPPSAVAETNHTTHYSVVDPEGNAVATTTTLNDTFGSRSPPRGSVFL